MKEQSHKAEMSAAIRGDFQRLRERGVSATLAPQEEADAAPPIPESDADGWASPEAQVPESATVEVAAEDVDETTVLVADEVPDAVEEAPAAAEDVEEPPAARRSSWLSRLVGR